MISFIPYQEFREAVERARHDVEAWHTAYANQKDAKRAEWAGSHLREMLRDREATIRLLRSPKRNLRLASITLVADYWPANERFAGETLRLAFEDPESLVRGGALVALLQLKTYIDDPTGFLRGLLDAVFPPPEERVMADTAVSLQQTTERTDKAIYHMCERAAGPCFADMLESRTSAELYLSHPEARLRVAALLILTTIWKPDERLPSLCEKLLCEDADLSVRLQALVSLAGSYIHTDNARIGSLIASMVYDDSNELELRVQAYQMLFTVRGMPVEVFLDAVSGDFSFPGSVNWQFVDSFLRPS